MKFVSICALLMTAMGGMLKAAPPPNVLFIAIDDLRNDLGSLGVPHAKTPSLDAFAKTARSFNHHYVQVPTCGASRCALLRGRYPDKPAHLNNNAIKLTQKEWREQSLPALFRKAGYQTLALGKITHYPGGLTGADWAAGPEEMRGVWDRQWLPEGHPWKTPQAIMHGYANGTARIPGKSPPLEACDGNDDAYPDAWLARDAVKTLRELSSRPDNKPWFFAVGFFKPHLPFAAPRPWHELHAKGVAEPAASASAKPAWPSGWHESREMNATYAQQRSLETDLAYASEMRRAYAACISYVDAQVGQVLQALKDHQLEDNTIVVIWGDHGMMLGEHAIWGKHCLYEQALRAPLMIRTPGMQAPGKICAATVETVDVLPTLAALCQLTAPDDMDGVSLLPQLADPAAPAAKPAHSFWSGGQASIRTDRWRLIIKPGSGKTAERIELFDYQDDPDESQNHAASHPEIVTQLRSITNPKTTPSANIR